MASVLPLRSAATGVVTYRVRFRIAGVQRQETFPDVDSAYEFKRSVDTIGGAAAVKVLRARHNTDETMPTLREWTEKYLDPASGLLTGIEPGTRDGYRRSAANSWLITLGDYPVDAIQQENVGQWLSWQEQQESKRAGGKTGALVAPKTIRNYHSLLSSVLAAAVTKGLRADNPAYRTRLPEGLRREGVFLSADEFSTLLYFIPDYYEGLVMFLAGSGARWGEATAITWGDLTPPKPPRAGNPHGSPATIRIDKAWKKSTNGAPVLKQPKSRMSRRTISLPPDVIAAMGTPGPANQLVFKGELSGTHLWYGFVRSRVWEPAVKKAMDRDICEQAGLTVLERHPTIHDLRHSHASWLIADGKPLPYIQARLGHENITTTIGTYGHLVPDAHQQMADSIGNTLSGVRHIRAVKPLEITQ